MLKSMTGYAQARAEAAGKSVRVTLRSVNHRFLDVHLKASGGLEAFDVQVRQMIRGQVRRGHIDVMLHYEPSGAAAVEVNGEVAGAYLEAIENMRKRFHLNDEPDLAAVLRLPGVVSAPEASTENDGTMAKLVEKCMGEALEKLNRMRMEEGEVLGKELCTRLKNINELSMQAEGLSERIRPAYARRLKQRLADLLEGAPIDPTRLAQEAALAAERSDTAEETARLRSHVKQFYGLIQNGGEVGKKCDFLLQEMQREANTLLSKTPGTEDEGLEITRTGLEIKSEIEKLREQVQNIE
jgi:uncharacterized protein (TIGR00255 family)